MSGANVFQSAFEQSPIAASITNPDGSWMRVNHALAVLLGYPETDLVGRSFQSLTYPDDLAENLECLRRALDGEIDSYRLQKRLVRADGTPVWVQLDASVVRGPDKTALYLVSQYQDLTERRRVEGQVRESEARFRALTERSSELICVYDELGNFKYANPVSLDVYGYSPEELVGRSGFDLIDPIDLARIQEVFRDISARPGGIAAAEFAVRHRDGSRRILSGVGQNLVADPAVRGFVLNAHDVTKRRRAEEQNRHLEQQLRQAQKLEAVGQLAGGVAHDFNNLLTVIASYTQIVLGELPPDSSATADLREIEAAAARAAGLTRQLLAFSRKQVLQPRRMDINQTVSEAAGMLRRIIGEDISLHTELAPALWTVHADPGQIEQVLMNLAVNARDAMARGGTLTLRTANLTVDANNAHERAGVEPGDYAAILVEDTGTGIDSEIVGHIFEPFFTTKAVGQGTGLGLATVYGIVKQSGGHIYVDSTVGAGSRFTVLLPRSDGVSEEAPSAQNEPPPRGTETILLVEDEEAVRAVVRRMLQRLGYTVLEAGDASAAFEVVAAADARAQRVDLVLTDVVMPGLNGRRLGELIRTYWPDSRVLYMSGYTDDEILRRGLVHADTVLLEKPFSTEHLARAVRSALDRPS